MATPTFTVVLLWEGSPSPSDLGEVLGSLGELFEGKSVKLAAALRPGGAALELVLELSLYQRALLNRMKAKVEWSRGHLVEIQRLHDDVREKFRAQYLRPGGTEPQAVGDFGEATRLLTEHFSKGRAAPPPPATRAGPGPGPGAAQGTPARSPASKEVPGPDASPPGASPRSGAPQGATASAGTGAAAGVTRSDAERRRAPRYSVRLEVAFQTNEAFVREYATNISKGGLFIQTAERPAVDAEVLVVLQLPSGKPVEIGGRVVCHVPTPPPGGVGLAFNERAKSLVALSDYLASLAGG